MTAPVRLAVVGAGIMGSNHARVARQLPGTDLAAVVDADIDRARAACGTSGAAALTSIDDLPTDIEAAVIATPTAHHLDLAVALAERGVHLLVEKPLALSVADGERISAAAQRSGVVLAVGHIERFNAAVAELPRLLEEPLHIETSRIGAYSGRVTDGVILDLMIHDVDIVLSLLGPDVEAVEIGGTARTVRSSTEDIATATIRFSNDVTATLNASRIAQQKIRTIEITQRASALVADLVRRDVTIHRMTHHEYLSDTGARYRQSSVVEIPHLEASGEPLQLELAHFADCVRGAATPRVDGSAGCRALELATRIAETIGQR